MLTKTKKKKKLEKNRKFKILKKKKKWSGDMVDRELPTKFYLDLHSGF